MQIMLKNVVVAFPAIAAMQSFGDGAPAYGAKLPIPPKSPAVDQLEEAMLEVAREKWGDKAASIIETLREDNKLCLTKKVYKSKKTGEAYAGFEGNHYLSARSETVKPTVFNQYGEELSSKPDIEKAAYSGSVCNVSLDIWAQDNSYGRRINAIMRGLMTTGEGTNLGGGSAPASADDFAEMAKPKANADDLL